MDGTSKRLETGEDGREPPPSEILSDEVETSPWDNNHDIIRVVDVENLGRGALERDVLSIAIREDLDLLTADRSDFSDPLVAHHPSHIVIFDVSRTIGESHRTLSQLEGSIPYF